MCKDLMFWLFLVRLLTGNKFFNSTITFFLKKDEKITRFSFHKPDEMVTTSVFPLNRYAQKFMYLCNQYDFDRSKMQYAIQKTFDFYYTGC